MIEIKVICEVPIQMKSLGYFRCCLKKIQKKTKKKGKKINFLRTDGRTTQNYSSEPHKKIQSIMIPIDNRLGNRNRVQNNYTSLAAFKKLT